MVLKRRRALRSWSEIFFRQLGEIRALTEWPPSSGSDSANEDKRSSQNRCFGVCPQESSQANLFRGRLRSANVFCVPAFALEVEPQLFGLCGIQ